MDAALRLDRNMIEGEVHQHRFAAPDAAPKVDARGAVIARPEQVRKQSLRPKSRGETVERFDSSRLCGIGLQFAGLEERGISRADRSSHRAGAFGRFTRFSVPLKL